MNPLNESFPEKFYLNGRHMTELLVKSDNKSVPHTEILPKVGDWYVVGVLPERYTQITQKVNCHIQIIRLFNSS